MRSILRGIVVVVLVGSAFACKSHGSDGPRPSGAECDRLFAHKAEVVSPKGASTGVKDAARMVFVKSDVTAQWCETMSRAQYDCEMKAATDAAMDACGDGQ